MQNETIRTIYQVILDNIDVGIHVIDNNGKTIIYNQKMMEIEGMEIGDVLDKNILDVFQFYQGEDSTLLNVLNNKKAIVNVQQTYFNNKGVEIKTINNTYPILNGKELIGAVEIVRDVTKLERMIQDPPYQKDSYRKTFEYYEKSSFFPSDVIDLGKKAAVTKSSVVIIGDSGTGKQRLAECIHNASNNPDSPYLVQNCMELPEEYIERLLFGTFQREGTFEKARNGTVVLEEIDSLSRSVQTRILSFLQGKRTDYNIKFVGTISGDPFDLITNGKLLKELYYRLSELTIFIPPLKERKENIPDIVYFLSNKYNEVYGTNLESISAEVLNRLSEYDWPGNIREIEHVIINALKLLLGNETSLQLHHLPSNFRQKVNGESSFLMQNKHEMKSLEEYIQEAEKYYIKKGLQFHDYNVTKTAKALGMSRQNLQYRIRKYNIEKS